MRLLLLATLFFVLNANAQYHFSGAIDNDSWQNNVYLSLIEDYRKIDGIYTEQIISKVKADSTGYFEFIGNQLASTNSIYKIHVDNCFEEEENKNHFNGHCNNSKNILFIAKNTDTINFPLAFDSEMFCEIKSKNQSAASFININALKGDMSFDYTSFRSETNRKLNNKKWFKILQDYGKNSNEPLAELYIYEFLTNKSVPFYSYYLEDLKSNLYYNELLERLQKAYPNTNYTKQYQTELAADKFTLKTNNTSSSINWLKFISILLFFSVLLNLWFWYKNQKNKSKKTITAKEQLTKQEQKIVNLILEEKSNKEIAQELFISISTVKTHINNIYKKLNAQSRTDIKQLFSN